MPMPDLWNANDASQYNITDPASYQPQGGFQHQIHYPKNADDYDKIPPGAMFVDPQDGKLYQKAPPQRGMEV